MTSQGRPSTTVVWMAIEGYLASAYDGQAPAIVLSRLETLRLCDEEGFYSSRGIERDRPEAPCRYALRLGSRDYPPMKLVIEKLPSRDDWVFRADTHDSHVCPPPWDAEYQSFRELMERNRAVAKAIETRWQALGLPTFSEFLLRDLEARRESQ